jgi:ribosome-associated protein
MVAVRINPRLAIPSGELLISFSRSSGPGGQNVNKLNTRAQLRFDLRNSPSLGPQLRAMAEAALRSRLTKDGVLVITCQEHREQARNVEDCIAKFVEVMKVALRPPAVRKRVRPPRRFHEARLESKHKRGSIKQDRSRDWRGDE